MNYSDQHIITSKQETIQKVRNILEGVYDPEIPVLSVTDLGILRDIKVDKEANRSGYNAYLQRLPGNGCNFNEHQDRIAERRVFFSKNIAATFSGMDHRLDYAGWERQIEVVRNSPAGSKNIRQRLFGTPGG